MANNDEWDRSLAAGAIAALQKKDGKSAAAALAAMSPAGRAKAIKVLNDVVEKGRKR